VLYVDAQRRQFRREAHRALLEARAQSPDQALAFVRSQRARDGAALRANLLIQSRFSEAEIGEAVTQLVADKRLVLAGNLVADAAWWKSLRQNAIEAIEEAHRAHPEHAGLPLNDLRAKLEDRLVLPELFDTLVRDLSQSGFAQAGVAIGRAAHRPELPPHLAEAGARLRARLAVKPLDPPSRKELAPDAASQQALRFLVRTAEAVELSEEVVLLAESFNRASDMVKKFLQEHGSATTSELRQALGTSRRIIIPLVERLDKDGLTRREGDKRVLKTNARG
jgi:selenocysteine-specific elongation factor